MTKILAAGNGPRASHAGNKTSNSRIVVCMLLRDHNAVSKHTGLAGHQHSRLKQDVKQDFRGEVLFFSRFPLVSNPSVK